MKGLLKHSGFKLSEKGFNPMPKGFSAGRGFQLWAVLNPIVSYFARWFNSVSYIEDGKIVDNVSGKYPLKPVEQSCLNMIDSNYLDSYDSNDNLVALINDKKKFAVVMDMFDRDNSQYMRSYLFGNTVNNSNFSLKNGNTHVMRFVRNYGTPTYYGTLSTENVLNGRIEVIMNGVDVTLKHDGVVIDSVATDGGYGFTINRFLNTHSANYFGLVAKIPYIKIYLLDSYSQSEIDTLDLASIDANYHFAFNNVGEITGQKFYDLMGSGNYLQICSSWSAANKSTCDGLNIDFSNGFATITSTGSYRYPKLNDGSGYAGLTGLETGFTEYPAQSKVVAPNVEIQNIDQDLIDIDVNKTWTDGVDTAKTVVLSNLVSDDVTIIDVADNQITDLYIIGEPWSPSYDTDASAESLGIVLAQSQVDEQLAYWAAKVPAFSGETFKIFGNANPSSAGIVSITILASQGNQVEGN